MSSVKEKKDGIGKRGKRSYDAKILFIKIGFFWFFIILGLWAALLFSLSSRSILICGNVN